jgi:hypothetical protein
VAERIGKDNGREERKEREEDGGNGEGRGDG